MCGCEAHWNLNAICSCDCRSHDQFVKDGPASSRFNQRLAVTAPDLSPAEAAIVARFEAAPAAPESFDPIAALRRGDAVLDGLDLQFRDDYTLTVVSRVRDALGPQEPSARHRPLGGGRCVCGQPIHTEADR